MPVKELGFESIYPIIEGYKDTVALGLNANFSDPMFLDALSFSASYSLDSELDLEEQKLTAEILNSSGDVLRTLSTDAEVGNKGGMGKMGYSLPAEQGTNRGVWDLRVAPIATVPGVVQFGSQDGRPVSGYTLAPGNYTLRLRLGDDVQEQQLELRWDANFSYSQSGIAAQQEQTRNIYEMQDELYRSVHSLQTIKEQAEARVKIAENVDEMQDTLEAANALIEAIDSWEAQLINRQRVGDQALNFAPQLDFHLSTLLGTSNAAMHGLTQGMRDRYQDIRADWQSAMAARDKLMTEDVAAFNNTAGSAILIPPIDRD